MKFEICRVNRESKSTMTLKEHFGIKTKTNLIIVLG